MIQYASSKIEIPTYPGDENLSRISGESGHIQEFERRQFTPQGEVLLHISSATVSEHDARALASAPKYKRVCFSPFPKRMARPVESTAAPDWVSRSRCSWSRQWAA